MGGEYLPDYAEGEVEIARIELESTTADVISIRVKKEGERIAYLIVDEYETEFNILPTHSDKPLTLSELVRLIDGAMEEGSLGLYYTQMNYEGGERSIEWLDQMRHFTRVESSFIRNSICTMKSCWISGMRRRKRSCGGSAENRRQEY